MNRGLLALAGATLLVGVAGCQTSRSWDQDCPGIYSGVRYYGSQLDSVPLDGKIFFTLDLPLSAVADTLLLPFSWAVDRQEPVSGWVPGCLWARKR